MMKKLIFFQNKQDNFLHEHEACFMLLHNMLWLSLQSVLTTPHIYDTYPTLPLETIP